MKKEIVVPFVVEDIPKSLSCHPSRQRFFYQCFFRNEPEEFKKGMLNYLVSDKDSRKQRIRYKNDDKFINTVDALTEEEINEVDKAIEVLFELSPFDEYFVEKTYCLIEGVTDYIKMNGAIDIGNYIRKTDPTFLKDPNFMGNNYTKRWKNSNLIDTETFDSRLINFTEKDDYRNGVIDYCKTYRETEKMKEWIQNNKVDIGLP